MTEKEKVILKKVEDLLGGKENLKFAQEMIGRGGTIFPMRRKDFAEVEINVMKESQNKKELEEAFSAFLKKNSLQFESIAFQYNDQWEMWGFLVK